MKKLLFFALAALLMMGASSCASQESDPDVAAAKALAQRVIPQQAKHFVFESLPAEANDFFTLRSEGGKIVIGGNNANSMAVDSTTTCATTATSTSAGSPGTKA